MPSGELRTKHLREEIEEADGTRIYISRMWPRGVTKGERFSERMPELSPSRELLDAYLEDEVDSATYEERFLDEMERKQAQERISELAQRLADGETITLLCDNPSDAPDEECHRFLVEAKRE